MAGRGSTRAAAAVETVAAHNLCFGAAEKYARRGWLVFPCAPRGKTPLTVRGVKDASADPEAILARWGQWPGANIGVATGAESGFFALDVDGRCGAESLRALEKRHGPLPETVEARTGGGGRHLFFRCTSAGVRNSVGKLGHGLDIRGNGGYVIVPPSIHPTGTPYEWRTDHSPDDLPIADAPGWLQKRISPEQVASTRSVNSSRAYAEAALARELAKLARATDGTRNNTLNAAAFRLAKYVAAGTLARDLVEPALSALAVEIGLSAREAQATVASGLTAGIDEYCQLTAGENWAPLPPQFSEDALALRFSEQYALDLRHVAALGRWLSWDGNRWREDDTLAVFDRARTICRAASAECGEAEKRNAQRIAQAATVAAVERLARSDRRHAATLEQFDADPWLLNTPTGTVDLRTAELRGHSRTDYLTKLTGAALANARSGCPLWEQFLGRVTGGDLALQKFLRRVAGYCLTGLTREHALFFLYGTGGNGKGTFVNTLAGVWRDYAKTAPIGTFLATRDEQHPTDLAGLRGARLVTAVEAEDGRRWAEAKIKILTGGDRVAARFMRQDFFEFTPQFKLLIAGNHKPGLRSVDEAIRRRMHLIPFPVTILDPERDLDLADKLREEWPAILRWAVEGCLQWQQCGLNPPAAVLDATKEYLDAEDRLTVWLEERCEIGPRLSTTSAALFADWKSWCEDGGEPPGTRKEFAQRLEARPGIMRTRQGKERTRMFVGITLRVVDP